MNKEYGYMVCVRNNQIDKIELNKVAGRLKTVDPQAGIITEAKAMEYVLETRILEER